MPKNFRCSDTIKACVKAYSYHPSVSSTFVTLLFSAPITATEQVSFFRSEFEQIAETHRTIIEGDAPPSRILLIAEQ